MTHDSTTMVDEKIGQLLVLYTEHGNKYHIYRGAKETIHCVLSIRLVITSSKIDTKVALLKPSMLRVQASAGLVWSQYNLLHQRSNSLLQSVTH